MADIPFTVEQLRRLRRRVTDWFRKQGRPLPWRETSDPYRIWISEIMLQQTTVQAVIPYFERFLSRFPTVVDLAQASEAEVLQYWEGLGYYSRGRNLRKAAIILVETHQGEFPRELQQLEQLPGIGRYTAGAIRSFAFDLPAPIVEANTERLYCRLLNYTDDPRSTIGKRTLWSFAEHLQPQRQAGSLNQALMELGSQVCTPKAPRCDLCPLSEWCLAFRHGTQQTVPRMPPRQKATPVLEATVAIRCQNQLLIQQYQPGARWAGLWDFPRFALPGLNVAEESPTTLTAAIQAAWNEQFTSPPQFELHSLTLSHELRHSVTRYRIRLLCTTATASTTAVKTWLSEQPATLKLISPEELQQLPMPVTGRKFLQHLTK